METFKTQFKMSGVLTYVTIEKISADTYGCVLNLVDFFEGGEQPTDVHDPDLILKHGDGWEVVGAPKINLEAEDLQALGHAIEAVVGNEK